MTLLEIGYAKIILIPISHNMYVAIKVYTYMH